ncbi:tetratricopeptide repeat protein, partial [Wenjunlia tyrosinilytica]|uniref:tetratricopeptide repeat protein n=1 Tax=Wenjunlia tyrosinilytica TaxID=1544741 RepID=UPI001E51B6C3
MADLVRVGPRTVVWLNEAQHYLGAGGGMGERVAAAVHTLLTDPARAPVLVLGTLWPQYADTYTGLPAPGAPDVHARVRELLAGRLIPVPDCFDATATGQAEALAAAGDRQLAHALDQLADGRLTQFLAGVPELLLRYETASPAARAVLDAAMDARRLGVGLNLPVGFLEQAAPDYLSDQGYDGLADNWFEQALAEATRTVHGHLAPLRRIRPRPVRGGTAPVSGPSPCYRLADYLEQHGRRERWRLCPPESFWQAAHDHLAPDDLTHLAHAARARHRLHWAERLYRRAADAGDTDALAELARMREQAGDWKGAEQLYRRAADAGDTDALARLALMREKAGDRKSAEQLYRQAADTGNTIALSVLARTLEEAGDRNGAEQLYRQAADTGNTHALTELAWMREQAGDRESAERLYRRAADAGDTHALSQLAWMREQAGDRQGAEQLARQAADAG